MIAVFLLAISLSIDSLGIGITYGIRSISVPVAARAIISLIAAVVTGLSLLIGTKIAAFLPGDWGKMIGVGFLIVLGAWYIVQSLQPDKKKDALKREPKVFQIIIKSFGITIQIIKDPKYGDLNQSMVIEPFEALYIGLALSLDSFGAGIAVATLGFSNLVIPFAVGGGQFLFLTVGQKLGSRIARFSKNNKSWGVLSGCLLIVLAVTRMYRG